MAEETSDLVSEVEQENRKRKRIQKMLSSSEESIDDSLLPTPPQIKKTLINHSKFISELFHCQHQFTFKLSQIYLYIRK